MWDVGFLCLGFSTVSPFGSLVNLVWIDVLLFWLFGWVVSFFKAADVGFPWMSDCYFRLG